MCAHAARGRTATHQLPPLRNGHACGRVQSVVLPGAGVREVRQGDGAMTRGSVEPASSTLTARQRREAAYYDEYVRRRGPEGAHVADRCERREGERDGQGAERAYEDAGEERCRHDRKNLKWIGNFL